MHGKRGNSSRFLGGFMGVSPAVTADTPLIAAPWRRLRGHERGGLDDDGGVVTMACKVGDDGGSVVIMRDSPEVASSDELVLRWWCMRRCGRSDEDGGEDGVKILAGKDGGSPEKSAGKVFRRRRRAVVAAGIWRGGRECLGCRLGRCHSGGFKQLSTARHPEGLRRHSPTPHGALAVAVPSSEFDRHLNEHGNPVVRSVCVGANGAIDGVHAAVVNRLAEEMNTPSKEDLDNLFGPMFEEYFEKTFSDTPINSTAQPTQIHKDSPSTSSIIVDEHEVPPIVTTSDEQTSPISLTEADEFNQEDFAHSDGNS
ncbi:hypothetical protein Tco_0688151 [Tanacetum coccineum]